MGELGKNKSKSPSFYVFWDGNYEPNATFTPYILLSNPFPLKKFVTSKIYLKKTFK